MPKKTRKQKIRSETRLQTLEIQYDFSKVAPQTPVLSASYQTIAPALKQDIFKTIIIGSLLILVECGLFVISQRFNW